jgi:DNA-binding response OmpR family regulator
MPAIVVCEDDPSIQRLVRAALAPTACELYIAGDGEQGFSLIASVRPALVITDLYMPKLDGIALAERVRATPAVADIPILFISASLDRIREVVDSDMRPVGVLRKPFSTLELRALVTRHLSAAAVAA